MSKDRGGLCEVRSLLIMQLERLAQEEQMPLDEEQRRCIYDCSGYDFSCRRYTGNRINLKEGGNHGSS